MYNIGHGKETRISEVKIYLWSLRKRGGFHGNRKEKRLRGWWKNHPDCYLNMGRKKRVIHGYQFFSLREWKNDRIPHKKRKFSCRVFHERAGKGTERNL